MKEAFIKDLCFSDKVTFSSNGIVSLLDTGGTLNRNFAGNIFNKLTFGVLYHGEEQ